MCMSIDDIQNERVTQWGGVLGRAFLFTITYVPNYSSTVFPYHVSKLEDL